MENPQARLFWECIRTIGECSDLGEVSASDTRLAHEPHCDLCNSKESTGRLLSGSLGLGSTLVKGTATFKPWRVPPGHEEEAMYWICKCCHRDLVRNRGRLLLRLLGRGESQS